MKGCYINQKENTHSQEGREPRFRLVGVQGKRGESMEMVYGREMTSSAMIEVNMLPTSRAL